LNAHFDIQENLFGNLFFFSRKFSNQSFALLLSFLSKNNLQFLPDISCAKGFIMM